MTSTVAAASRKHVELSLELKRKLIQEHEHGVPFTLLGKKYHIATSTAANIWRKKDFFLRSRMSGSRKRCNDRSKYKIVNQVTALFVKSMLERNHKIDGEVIKRFARTAAAQCNFKDFHGSNGWLDSFKKRENVCWVRRRGERSAAAAAAMHLAENGQAQSSSSGGADLCRRSDSPNLSAAAAAAAVAATAQQQQHHNHRHSPNPLARQQWPASTTGEQAIADSASAADQPAGACARCSVAAAAAAVAALNSSDSLHERDHEIEDWFHGIPFLCQFFEDYQSMHQNQVDNHSSNNHQIAGSHQQQQVQLQHQQHQQQHSSMIPMSSGGPTFVIGAGPTQQQNGSNSICSSSSSSSTCSSSYLHNHHHPQLQQQQQQQSLTLAANSSSSSLAGNNQNCLGPALSSSSSSPSTASSTSGVAHSSSTNNNTYLPGRSLSDAHELLETSFRTSSSLADIQSLCGGNQTSAQQNRTISTDMLAATSCSQRRTQHHQQIKCEQYSTISSSYESAADNNNIAFQQQQQQPTANFSTNSEQQLQASNPANPNPNNSSTSTNDQQQQQHQQLMEINFTQQQANSEQALDQETSMEVVVASATGSDANGCCQLDSCQNQNKVIGRTSISAGATNNGYNSDDQDFYLSTTRYIPLDARSDDLLYHDEVSDHNDCCSDHYDQTGTGRSELQHLQDQYQTDCLPAGAPQNNQAAGGGASGGATCYMDEYEYENISTIRHYPVPMPPPPPPAQVTSIAAQEDPTNYGEHQQQVDQCQQQQQQQQLGACALTRQSFAAQLGGQQQLTAADYLQQQQQQQQQGQDAGEQLKVLQQQQEHEQIIEHADHEEHNMLHNALMRSPEKLKLIDSIITLLNYASNYNQKMLVPLLEIKRCIERDLEVVLSDTTAANGEQARPITHH